LFIINNQRNNSGDAPITRYMDANLRFMILIMSSSVQRESSIAIRALPLFNEKYLQCQTLSRYLISRDIALFRIKDCFSANFSNIYV